MTKNIDIKCNDGKVIAICVYIDTDSFAILCLGLGKVTL